MINAISVLLEILAAFFCINYFYDKKIRLCVYDAVFLVAELCIVEGANVIDVGKKIIVLGYFLLFLYQLIKFKVNTGKVCVSTMLLVCSVVALQLLSSIPLIYLHEMFSIRYLVLITNLLVLVIIMSLGHNGVLTKCFVYACRHEWFVRVCLGCSLIGAVYLIVAYKLEDYLRPTDFVVFGGWTFLIFIMAMNWQKTKEQFKSKQRELERQQFYDEYTRGLLKSVIRKQHDFDNYLQAILAQVHTASTLEDLKKEQKTFIAGIKEDNRYNKLLAGGKSLIVGFLYSKFTEAESEGCNITYIVKTKELQCDVPVHKLIEIIGILFDNAVEAVQEKEEKDINFVLVESDEQINLAVSNASEYISQEKIHTWLLEGNSTKGEQRGIGLANVVSIAEEYSLDFRVYNKEMAEGNRIEFAVDIHK